MVVIKRLAMVIPMMVAVSIVIFALLRLLPNDPLALLLPADAKPEDIAAMRVAYGLDLPIWQQYFHWITDVAQGDLGDSLAIREPVVDLIAESLPATLELVSVALFLGMLVGIGGGLLMFSARNKPKSENSLDLVSSIMMATPEFLWGIAFILLFGVMFNLLPFVGRIDTIHSVQGVTGFLLVDSMLTTNWDAMLSIIEHLLLPAAALAFGFAPLIMRVIRSSLLDVSQEDFVTAGRQRGLSESRILLAHILPNASLPTLSMVGVQTAFLFGGTLLIEVIFSYPGMGALMTNALHNHDVPVIQGIALVYCLVVLVLNALIDIFYMILNPKLRPV